MKEKVKSPEIYSKVNKYDYSAIDNNLKLI